MADTAAWLVDRVFPAVPVRQWVLALLNPVRFLCACESGHRARGARRGIVVAAGSHRTSASDGRMLLDPLTFIARLAALAPRPRAHLVTYHGLFAPASPWRSRVVPPLPEEVASPMQPASPPPSGHASKAKVALRKPPALERDRYSWAELLRRVFHIDVFLFECGGPRRLLVAILDRDSIRRVLLHLALPAEPPAVAPARPPPAAALPCM